MRVWLWLWSRCSDAVTVAVAVTATATATVTVTVTVTVTATVAVTVTVTKSRRPANWRASFVLSAACRSAFALFGNACAPALGGLHLRGQVIKASERREARKDHRNTGIGA